MMGTTHSGTSSGYTRAHRPPSLGSSVPASVTETPTVRCSTSTDLLAPRP